MAGFTEECGILAIAQNKNAVDKELAYKVHMGLLSIQHRGQESAGIAVADDGVVSCYKDTGLVSEVFNDKILSLLNGALFLAHVQYSGAKDKFSTNAQPTVVNYKNGSLAVAFNGALVNGDELRGAMANDGVIFSTQGDSELVAALVARYDRNTEAQRGIGQAVAEAVQSLRGGYAIGMMTARHLIGVRDPYGIRPLVLGMVNGAYALASESCAIDMMDGTVIRDLRPGEVLVIEGDTLTSYDTATHGKRAGCIFEYVYFANPDSTIDGHNVYQAREHAGYILAKESPADADLVTGVPDSATPAALGFARGSGLPYAMGLIINKYVGRTFIQPTQSQRERSVRVKLNPIKPVVAGKRIVLVDDSIVRGTTMRYLISAIRGAGATEVHLRISSPPVLSGCYFGVDTADKSDLIANQMTTEQIRAFLGADSLAYLSIEGMRASLGEGGDRFCTGCFSGCYPEV